MTGLFEASLGARRCSWPNCKIQYILDNQFIESLPKNNWIISHLSANDLPIQTLHVLDCVCFLAHSVCKVSVCPLKSPAQDHSPVKQHEYLLKIKYFICYLIHNIGERVVKYDIYIYSRHPSILSDNGKRHGSGHVVLSLVKARLQWPLQGASLGKGIWKPCTAHTTRPPARPHWLDPRECRAIHLGSAWLQELPEGSHHRHPATWGVPLLIRILDLLP